MKELFFLSCVFVLLPILQASAQTPWLLNGNSTSSGDFLGTTNYQDLELRANNVPGLRIQPSILGAINILGGDAANNTGTLGGVRGATIAGGGQSNAPNSVTGNFTAVGGGFLNTAGPGEGAIVAGGGRNTASGFRATVGGGESNSVKGSFSFAVGDTNTAGGYASFAAGNGNTAVGDYSFAVGAYANADHSGTFVWSDSSGNFASTADYQFLIRASGGVGIGTPNPRTQLHVQDTYPQFRLSDPATTDFGEIGSGTHGLAISTGPGVERLRILHYNGFVGIGTSGPSQRLHVIGNVRVEGVVSELSTIQEKKSVNRFDKLDYSEALRKVSKLEPVTFLYNHEPDDQQPHLGILAEDSPHEILNSTGDSINLTAYTTLLLASLKAQQEEIKHLKTGLTKLQQHLNSVTGQ